MNQSTFMRGPVCLFVDKSMGIILCINLCISGPVSVFVGQSICICGKRLCVFVAILYL